MAGCLVWCSTTNRFLLGKRSSIVKEPGTWDIFGGYLKSNESYKQGAIRELKEETRLEANVIYPLDLSNRYYTFLVIFETEPEVILNNEHTEARWVTLKELRQLRLHSEFAAMMVSKRVQSKIDKQRMRYL